MKWLTIILVYVLNIRSKKNFITIQKVFLIENNFWCGDKDQLKTNEGYLGRVYFEIEWENNFTDGFNYYFETCYYLKSTNLGYLVPRYWTIEEDFNLFLNSPEVYKFLLRFRFLFIDEPIKSLRHSKKYEGQIREYETYKSPEKISKNCIKLKCDVTRNIRMNHIKKMFKGLLDMKLLKFYKYVKCLNKIKEKKICKIEDDENFDLYYFKNHLECLDNLKKFNKNLCYFKLQKDGFFNLYTLMFSKTHFDESTTLKVSQFKKRLNEYFYFNIKNWDYKKVNCKKIDKTWKLIFNECFDYLKNVLLENKIYLPIGGKYNINYYIEQLSKLIYNLAKKEQDKYKNAILGSKGYILYEMIYSFKLDIEKLQLSIVQDFCEFEYVPKHFSELIEKEVKTLDDYIEVEKIVCDYYNMFAYLFNLYNKFNKITCIKYSYYPPIFIDDYNIKIVDGIKIELKPPAKCIRIKLFDNKGKEVIMIKGVDYFIDEFGILYSPSEVLKMRNIYEIEVSCLNNTKNNKRIRINDYLSL